MGQDVCKSAFVCGLFKEINSIKVGEGNKIVKEHIEEGVFALPGTVLKAWAKAKDKDGKDNIFLCRHCTVMPGGIVELSAPLQFSAIANGHRSGADGECLGVMNLALMKIKVSVLNGRIDEAKDFTFDWVGVCAPYIGGRGEHV